MRGNFSFFNVFFTHYPGDVVLKMFVVCVILAILSVLQYVISDNNNNLTFVTYGSTLL